MKNKPTNFAWKTSRLILHGKQADLFCMENKPTNLCYFAREDFKKFANLSLGNKIYVSFLI